MRTAVNNPFSPGSDRVPQIWAGRTEQLSDWANVVRPRRNSGIYERGRTILGEAGLGKSALVRKIFTEAEQQGDWVTPQLRIPLGADPLAILSSGLLDLADRAGIAASRERHIRELISRVRTIQIKGASLTLERAQGPEPFSDLTNLLVAIGKAAMHQGKVVLIHLDEVQNMTDERALSQLLVALGDAIDYEVKVQAPGGYEIRRTLPIAVYLTGLPDFEELAGAKRGATFARRFATTVLPPISDTELRAALQQFVAQGWPVTAENGALASIYLEPAAADLIVKLSCGEPFLFQLVGDKAWYQNSSPIITAADVAAGWERAKGEAENHVERILVRLPEKERELLEAMASLPPEERSAKNIAQVMGLASSAQIGSTARSLDITRRIIKRGNPYSFRHHALEAYLTTTWPEI